MSRLMVKHTKFDIAKTLGAAVAISAISNAAEAVASVASTTGLAVGNFVFLESSGWSGAKNKVLRIKALVENTSVTLEGFNTTDTVKFPAGGGASSLRKIVDWERISDIKSLDPSGGEAKFADGTTLDDEVDVEVPNGYSASRMTAVIYDDTSNTFPVTIEAAERGGVPVPMRVIAPNGAQLVNSANWSISAEPKFDNGHWVRTISAALAARSQRYVG